jgi:MSHA pilin protein MshC
MVELTVVMLLMGILAAVALPRLTSRTVLQERGLHDQTKSMLQYVRKVAVTQRRDACVLLSATQIQAVYTVANACSLAAPINEPGNSGAFIVQVPSGIAVGGAALVRFNPLGQPVPNNNLAITLGTLGLTISRETGFVL